MKNQKIAVFCQSYFNIGKPFSRILYMKMPPCGTIVPHGGIFMYKIREKGFPMLKYD